MAETEGIYWEVKGDWANRIVREIFEQPSQTEPGDFGGTDLKDENGEIIACRHTLPEKEEVVVWVALKFQDPFQNEVRRAVWGDI